MDSQQNRSAYVPETRSTNPPQSHGHAQQINRLLPTAMDSNMEFLRSSTEVLHGVLRSSSEILRSHNVLMNEALRPDSDTFSQQTLISAWQPQGPQIPVSIQGVVSFCDCERSMTPEICARRADCKMLNSHRALLIVRESTRLSCDGYLHRASMP